MKPTYQHKSIGQYLQITYSQVRNWPFHSAEHVADELCSRDVALVAGQFLVIGMNQDGIHCGAIDGLAGLADFPADSIVISYSELERAFYEQHQEWIERSFLQQKRADSGGGQGGAGRDK